MSEEKFIRELGRPQVGVATNGLREIVRRYAVVGSAAPDSGVIAELPYWQNGAPTFDEEFETACLVEQSYEKSEDGSHNVLVRKFQELGSSKGFFRTDAVEVGKPNYKREANNLLEITREFIQARVAEGDWKKEELVGHETFESAVLSKIEADEGVVFVRFKKTYIQTGIISTKHDILHDGQLESYTIRSVGLASKEDVFKYFETVDLSDFDLVSELEGSGSVDYKFGGLQVRTWEFVKGYGLIKRSDEDLKSGSVTIEVWLTTDAERPTPGIAEEDIFFEEKSVLEKHTLWTFRGVTGDGVLLRVEDIRFDERVTELVIRQINTYPDTPEGFVIIGSREDFTGKFPVYERTFLKVVDGVIGITTRQRGTVTVTTETIITLSGASEPESSIPNPVNKGFDIKEKYTIWTFTGVSGDGVLEQRTDYQANGAIEVTTIKFTGETPPVPTGASLISEATMTEDLMEVTRHVYVTAGGEIRRTNETKGDFTIVTTTVVTAPDAADPADGLTVFEKTVEQKDGYTVHTWRTVEGEGVLEQRNDYQANGAIEIITIKFTGEAPPAPAGATLISESTRTEDLMEVTQHVYVTAGGEIRQTTENKGGVTIVTTTVVTAPDGADPTAGMDVFEKTTEQRDGYAVHTWRTVEGSGILSSNREWLHNKTLEKYTIKTVGISSASQIQGLDLSQYVLVEEMEGIEYQFGGIEVRMWTYVSGEGLIRRSTDDAGAGDVVEEVWLTVKGGSRPSPGIAEDTIFYEEVSHNEKYSLWTFRGTEGEGVLLSATDYRFGEHVTQMRIRKIEEYPDEPSGFITIGETIDRSGRFPVYERVFLKIQAGVIGTVVQKRGEVTVTTETHITEAGSAKPSSSIADPVKTESEIKEQYMIWTFTGVEGEGVLERRVDKRANGAITITTLKWTGAEPSGEIPAGATKISEGTVTEDYMDVNLGVWATGSGEIQRTEDVKGDVTIIGHTQVVASGGADPATGENVFEKRVEQESGYVVYSWKTVEGSGSFYTQTETLHDGLATMVTHRYFGEATIPDDAVEDGVDSSGNLKVTWYKVVSGEGIVSEKTEGRSDGLLYTTQTYIGSDPGAVSGGHLLSRGTDKRPSYTLTTDVYVSTGNDQIEIGKRTEANGVILTTVSKLGSEPTGFGAPVSRSQDNIILHDGSTINHYKYTYASGSGVFFTNTYSVDGVRKTRIRSINVVPSGTGCIESEGTIEHKDIDGSVAYTEYDYLFISGSGILHESKEVRGHIATVEVRSFGNANLSAYGLRILGKRTEYVNDSSGASCGSIVTTKFLTGGSDEIRTRKETRDGVTYSHKSTFAYSDGAIPQNAYSSTTEAVAGLDGVTVGYILEWVEVSGNGEYFTQTTKDRDDVNIKRVRAIDQGPQAGVCTLNHIEEPIQGQDGKTLLTRHSYDIVQNTGTVEEERVRMQGVDLVRTRAVNAAPAGGGNYDTRKVLRKVFDAYGKECYTVYDVTYLEGSGEGFILTEERFLANGARTVTVSSYEDYKDPMAFAPSGSSAATGVKTEIERGMRYDSEGRKIYTVTEFIAPDDYYTYETREYFEYGEIELSSDAEVTVTKQPVRDPKVMKVEVYFTLDANGVSGTPQRREAAPVVTQTLHHHEGSKTYSKEIYHDYIAPSGSSGPVSKSDTEVDGMAVHKVTRKLEAGSGITGTPGLVELRVEVFHGGGGGTIYKVTKVTVEED
jgi:hypothetical protein